MELLLFFFFGVLGFLGMPTLAILIRLHEHKIFSKKRQILLFCSLLFLVLNVPPFFLSSMPSWLYWIGVSVYWFFFVMVTLFANFREEDDWFIGFLALLLIGAIACLWSTHFFHAKIIDKGEYFVTLNDQKQIASYHKSNRNIVEFTTEKRLFYSVSLAESLRGSELMDAKTKDGKPFRFSLRYKLYHEKDFLARSVGHPVKQTPMSESDLKDQYTAHRKDLQRLIQQEIETHTLSELDSPSVFSTSLINVEQEWKDRYLSSLHLYP